MSPAAFNELAAIVSMMGDRFRAAGLNPPRLVLTQGDADAFAAMIPAELMSHYSADPAALATISGVKVYRPRST